MKYKIGLECGGLMEYEGCWELHDVIEIEAASLEDAKSKWAELTGENKSDLWNPETKTVWGFAVVEEADFFNRHPKNGAKYETTSPRDK
jgi:hypothetical protein